MAALPGPEVCLSAPAAGVAREEARSRLSIRGLGKTYGNGVRALDGVSLEIPRGMFGLLGANGAGKTTLMNILATLVRPDEGHVLLDGVDALADPMVMRRNVGYLPQEFGVYPGMSAFDMLIQFAALKGLADSRQRREHVEELLEVVNLHHVAHRAVDTYSGGMRRRFGVAQSLLGWPKVVIVDEPTAGLDPLERNRFQHALNGIGDRAIVILSTHIVEDVANICTAVAVMDGGRLVASGAPDELTSRLRGRVWTRLIERDQQAAYGEKFTVLAAVPFRGSVRIAVLAPTCPGEGFETYEPSLEDVFFAARTGHFRR
jgi:ABC-2 type transport system ATP-binding protein